MYQLLIQYLTMTGMYQLLIQYLIITGMYLLTNIWWALMLEMFDAISSGLFMTAAVLHLGALVPSESMASFRGLLGTAYMGIGGQHFIRYLWVSINECSEFVGYFMQNNWLRLYFNIC